MKYNSDELYHELNKVREKVEETINETLDERLLNGDKSINMHHYQENCVSRMDFSGADSNGYGSRLTIDSIKKVDGSWLFAMIDEDGDPYEDRELSDFNTSEQMDILVLLEETFGHIDEYEDGKILEEGEYED